ncbi:Myb/SANT-like domain containing protein [Trema orientale]|uniref:Myb/SANT-like domain containing protein n=1 Tax=Trema orientale TaxID=63057 RepID=A0A2P5EWU5_TREOI|nr:Myb/SANT-like domain containing protein [Trema orientale]
MVQYLSGLAGCEGPKHHQSIASIFSGHRSSGYGPPTSPEHHHLLKPSGQEAVVGRPKAEWTPSRDAYLIELFIEQHNCGRTAYNEFKNEVIRSVTRDFNRKFGMNLEENQIKNRYNVMKKDYGVVKTLLSHAGFGWDEIRQMVVADDKVWDNYIAIKSEARPFRRKSFPLYNQMSIIFEGESRAIVKQQFPSGLHVTAEEGNSNTETVRSSEPTNLPAQVVDGTPDSDSMIRIDDDDDDDGDESRQQKKRKSEAPTTSVHKRKTCSKVRETIENALYEMFCSANLKAAQRKALNEKTLYQKCLEELQRLEELDDMEFTRAVNVLKDDKNAVAFMTIKGPRRLTWLRSLWPA